MILTSYEATFAESWGRKVKELISEYGEKLFGVRLDPGSSSSKNFGLQGHSGGMSCAGAGGPITGKGADIFIIDDPVKNDADANSPVIREKIWDWFKATAYTRLEPNGVIIIIMTRWHEDDLCGKISKYMIHEKEHFSNNINEDWVEIIIPAIAGDNDPLGRIPGSALWEERYGIEQLNSIKSAVGSYWFSTLYQQKPSPVGGGIFKRIHFKYFDQNDEHYYLLDRTGIDENRKVYGKSGCSIFAVMDLASSTKETADYTVVLVFALTPDNDVLVLEIIRERFEGAEHINLLKRIFTRWKPVVIGIESVQYQIALVQSAMREGLPVKQLKADKDKVTRSLPIAARLEAGTVYFKNGAHWLDEFENELLSFPKGRHDDQVDAFAYIQDFIQSVSGLMPAGSTINRISGKSITSNF